MKARSAGWFGAQGRWLAVAAVMRLAALWLTAADPPVAVAPTSPRTRTVVLSSHESACFPIQTWASHSIQPQPFAKEPSWGAGAAVRGRLRVGGKPEHELPFLWRRDRGRLVFDLNRNGDLSDDPVLTNGSPVGSVQTFASAKLRFRTIPGELEYLANLSLYPQGRDLTTLIQTRSVWTGRLELAERAWEIAVVEDLAASVGFGERAQLVIRPWEDRERPWDQSSSFTDAGSPLVRPPRRLFLAGQEFEVRGRWLAEGRRLALALDLEPKSAPLGRLEIEGQHVHRLVLRGDGRQIVLADPGPAPELPVGTYRVTEVGLRAGSFEAVRQAFPDPSAGPVAIQTNATARLKVGGPLTNTVSVTRRRDTMVLNYELLGADGRRYALVKPNRAEPPAFAIYRDAAKVASGRFQYG